MSYADYRDATVRWYRGRLDEAQPNVRVLSSGTEERRRIRFEVLRGVGIRPGARVLDVGCGLADFHQHLLDAGVEVDYTGVDIVPEFVERARRRFPRAAIECRDILEDPFPDGSFDVVVASQVLNLRFPAGDNDAIARRLLTAMHRVAREGVACDFVTDHVDFREDYLHYHSPEALFRFAKTLSKRVVLRHDYPLFEFCLYIYPDFAGWSR